MTSSRPTTPPSNTVLELTGVVTPISSLAQDLWRNRDLLPMLAAKDFHARYRSAALGVLWSVMLPLLQGAVLAVVFTKIVRIPVSTGTSYPVLVISGMILWTYFSQSLTAGSTAIVDGGGIASKVYFPRAILPAVPALTNIVGLGISMVVMIGLMVGFGVRLHVDLLLLPFAGLMAMLLSALFASILAVAHVYFRDVRYVLQASLLVLIYATPVIYPLERAGDYEPLLLANPMTGVVQVARQAIFGDAHRLGVAVATSIGWVGALVVVAALTYRRHERVAVDRL